MEVEKNKRVVRAFYEAGNSGNIDAALGLMDENVTWLNMGSTKLSGTYNGKQDLLDNLIGPLFSQLEAGIESTVQRMIAEADYVAVQVNGRAKTTSGKPYNNTYCHVFRICDGKIIEVTEYLDTELTSSVLDA